jgi:hypothetical protein
MAMKDEERVIYGQRSRKLNYVQQYMAKEGADYELADNVVAQLEEKVPAAAVRKETAVRAADEGLLSGRRVPSQKKPVLVRHFHFIE